MSKLIYTSFSPNTRLKDYLLNWNLLFKPWAVNKGPYSKLVESIFEQKFPESKAYTFNLARSGMHVLFKSLNLEPKSEIIVQGFTCIAAINPILWAGLKPVYCDINKATLNLDIELLKTKITSQTRAIMFQHTFGNSAGIQEVSKLCEENNILLIEDCTNTVFGKHHEQLQGSFGDASIFSFGRDKAVSGVSGGLILINNRKLVESFEQLYKKIKHPSTGWTYSQLIYPLVWQEIKFGFSMHPAIGKLAHAYATKLRLISRATTKKEKQAQPEKNRWNLLPNALAQLAHTQLKDIDILNSHRIDLGNIYKQNAKTSLVTFEEGNVPLRYPILLKDKAQTLKTLRSRNIYLGDWYDNPITPISTDYEKIGYIVGSCPNSEEICKGIANLPTHINITHEDAHKILNAL